MDSKFAYLKSTLTALQQQWKWSVAGHELFQGARKLDQQWGELARNTECWERPSTAKYRAGVGKLQFMINEVPEIAYAVKNLSRQLAKPSESDLHELKQCCEVHTGTQRRIAVPDGAR